MAWARRFILLQNKRHPTDMGATEVRAFLKQLAVNRRVAASAQNQALNAIVFMYREVLRRAPRPQAGNGAKGSWGAASQLDRLPYMAYIVDASTSCFLSEVTALPSRKPAVRASSRPRSESNSSSRVAAALPN